MALPPIMSEAFLDLPALAPPPGVIPNFVNPPNLRAPGLAGLQFSLATLAVMMRLYTKKFVVKKALIEDWFLFAAWIAFIGFNVQVLYTENIPLGLHQYDTTFRVLIRTLYLFWVGTTLYCVVACPLKVAIILQIRRIVLANQSSDKRSPKRILLRGVIDFFLAANVIYYAFIPIFQLVTCTPMRKAWDFRLAGHCVGHKFDIHISSGVLNTVSDVVIVILPQHVIWKLKMPIRRKIGLSTVFLLGLFASAISAVRLYFTLTLVTAQDLTYHMALLGKVSEPELTLGFLAACLPVLPTFLRTFFRTTPGRKVRALWTTSPLTETRQTGDHHNATIGSKLGARGTRITRKSQIDIEFAQLTAEHSRSNSMRGLVPAGHHDAEKGRRVREEVWSEHIVRVQAPRPTYGNAYI